MAVHNTQSVMCKKQQRDSRKVLLIALCQDRNVKVSAELIIVSVLGSSLVAEIMQTILCLKLPAYFV